MGTEKFVNAIEREVAWKVTENGQPALNTTFDANLDLFSTIGALRERRDDEIVRKFSDALMKTAYLQQRCYSMQEILTKV